MPRKNLESDLGKGWKEDGKGHCVKQFYSPTLWWHSFKKIEQQIGSENILKRTTFAPDDDGKKGQIALSKKAYVMLQSRISEQNRQIS